MDRMKRLRKTGSFYKHASRWGRGRIKHSSFLGGTERNRNCGAVGERETKIGSLLYLGEHFRVVAGRGNVNK
uniref:Uncharacterized protein n=1 Tax=Anopheles atroparvus TaxID=41427 RepID=A0AAG5DGP1_ANOAO